MKALSINELLDLAKSREWWVWTITVSPENGMPILSASTPFFGQMPTENLFSLPMSLCLDELRADLFVSELNRLGGWDDDARYEQEQRLALLRNALPRPTVSYAGIA